MVGKKMSHPFDEIGWCKNRRHQCKIRGTKYMGIVLKLGGTSTKIYGARFIFYLFIFFGYG